MKKKVKNVGEKWEKEKKKFTMLFSAQKRGKKWKKVAKLLKKVEK